MSNFFNYDNKLFTTLGKATDAVILGILWMICSIPVFTIGASSTAFYYAYNKCVRQRREYAWKEFFSAFKENFKQATKIWMIIFVISLLSIVDYMILNSMRESVPFVQVLMVVLLVVFIVVTMIGLYVFPYVARFENDVKASLKNAALIMIANFFWSLLLLLLFVAAVLGFLLVPFASLFIPAIYMAVTNIIQERVFKKYMTPEDLEKEKEYSNK